MQSGNEITTPTQQLLAQKKRSGAPLWALAMAVAIAVGGVAFAAGRITAPPAAAATGFRGANGQGLGGFGAPGLAGNGNGGANGGGAGGGRFGGFGGLSVQGTVTALSNDTMTVQLSNGRTATIKLQSSTAYHREVSGSASDVKQGATVLVQVAPSGQGGQPRGGEAGTTPTLDASSVTVVP